MSAYERAHKAAVDGVVEAARYWASADETGRMPDGYSIEDSCERLMEALGLLDRIEGRYPSVTDKEEM